jgi:competence protein ComEC
MSVDIGEFWMPGDQEISTLLEEITETLDAIGVSVEEVGAGTEAHLGEFAISVVGPRRRYAAENDGSIVLLAEVNGVEVLLPGDVGALAQRELPALRPDVLLVPHHGAGTTDLEWLTATVSDLAVISVGENAYGHPTPEVVATLEATGAEIRMTSADGDVVVPLAPAPVPAVGSERTLVGP